MKKTDTEIIALIEEAEANSYGLNDSALSFERKEALDYFYGRNFGNEVEGRSQVVSHDVKDTILWALTATMKPFVAGDEVVVFNPVGPEDVEAAEQESVYINNLFMEKNDGFNIIHNWQFDGFLSKVGYVKVYWEDYETTKKETYQGLSDEELALLLQDPEVRVLGHSGSMDEMGNAFHDVQVEVISKSGRVCVENVAPEDIMVGYDVKGTSLKDAYFVEQRSMPTLSELREMGFNVDDNIQGDDSNRYEQENFSRDNYNEFGEEYGKDANRRVLCREVYMRVDMDGDGVAELNRFVVVGTTILDQCECEAIPYVAFCPNPMPHRHVGLSEADLVKDLQLIKSTLLRNALDAQNLALHGRFAISDRVNLDDMLVSRAGGVVRVDGEPAGAIMPLISPTDGTKNLSMIEYVDQIRQTRTGVTDSFQGMDTNALNKTKGGTQMLMNAAASRIEVVTRHFANSLRDMFLLMHEQVRKHANKQEIFRLRNKWVPVDPRTWATRSDMTVSVGLGTGNKDQMLQHLLLIGQAQEKGAMIGIATPKNMYNTAVKLTQNAGFKEAEEFWTDPEGQKQSPKGPSEAEIKAQAEMQKAQMDNQTKQAQIQMDLQSAREKMAMEMQLGRERMNQEMQIARDEMVKEMAIARDKMMAEMQIKRESMDYEAEVKMHQIAANANVQAQKIDSRPGIE